MRYVSHVLYLQLEDVLQERKNQMKLLHQQELDRLKREHENNIKNITQQHSDQVHIEIQNQLRLRSEPSV